MCCLSRSSLYFNLRAVSGTRVCGATRVFSRSLGQGHQGVRRVAARSSQASAMGVWATASSLDELTTCWCLTGIGADSFILACCVVLASVSPVCQCRGDLGIVAAVAQSVSERCSQLLRSSVHCDDQTMILYRSKSPVMGHPSRASVIGHSPRSPVIGHPRKPPVIRHPSTSIRSNEWIIMPQNKLQKLFPKFNSHLTWFACAYTWAPGYNNYR